jgi:uncharacterized protein YdaU (DUF1376 family)
MNYYSFHIGDYRGATAHLTNDEDLCYRRILDLYYDKDGELPDIRNISRRVRFSEETVNAILEEFFVFKQDRWVNDRAQRDIDAFTTHQEASKRGGKASANTRTARPLEGPLKAPSTPLQHPLKAPSTPLEGPLKQPITINHKPITISPLPPKGGMVEEGVVGRDWSAEFEAFWTLYPDHRKTNRFRAQTEWSAVRLSLPPQNELEAALCAFKASPEWKRDAGKYVPAPHIFLSERRWQDAPAYSPKAKPKAKAEVDEDDALRWRCEVYPESEEIHPTWQTFPFSTWPESTRREYRESKTQLQVA